MLRIASTACYTCIRFADHAERQDPEWLELLSDAPVLPPAHPAVLPARQANLNLADVNLHVCTIERACARGSVANRANCAPPDSVVWAQVGTDFKY